MYIVEKTVSSTNDDGKTWYPQVKHPFSSLKKQKIQIQMYQKSNLKIKHEMLELIEKNWGMYYKL